MNNFIKRAGTPRSSAANVSSGVSSSTLSSLFHYPALGRLFEGADNRLLSEMRARLTQTNQDLERVIRHGSKDDADRATRATRAYRTTLSLLVELERLRNNTAR